MKQFFFFKKAVLNPHWIVGLAVSGFLVGMFLAKDANAMDDQLWLDFNLASSHITRDYWWNEDEDGNRHKHDYNENNFGVGLSYGINDYIDAIGGTIIQNSYNNFSAYGAVNLKYPIYYKNAKSFRVEPGVMLGIATGYKGTVQDRDTVAGLLPFTLLNVTVVFADFTFARVGWLPDIDGKSTEEYPNNDRSGIITFQIGVNLSTNF